MPTRLPGMLAPRSEPANAHDLERVKARRGTGAQQVAAPVEQQKKQQQDLISSEDSWSMTREREEVRAASFSCPL